LETVGVEILNKKKCLYKTVFKYFEILREKAKIYIYDNVFEWEGHAYYWYYFWKVPTFLEQRGKCYDIEHY
jgi:hypothetical protein